MTTLGRPSKFSQGIADKVCALLATGKSLRAICREDDDMPDESTIRQWAVEDYKGFYTQYARARDLGLDAMADETIEIADTTQEGIKTKVTDEGEETTHSDMIEHRRLRVDTRKWYLSKLAPKRYGERLNHELTGKDGAPLNPTSVSDAQLVAALNALAHSGPAEHTNPLGDDDDASDLV